jgi:23S rRNA (pseudouridine1915-N3)-methyltransferase
VAVGRLRPYYREAADDYLRRLRRYLRIEELELRVRGRRTMQDAIEGWCAVALTRDGTAWSSEDLARRLGEWRLAGRPVALVIGGPEGLEPAVLETAHLRWSLGPLTLPHELARVVVLEQLYRAATMLAGHPYHQDHVGTMQR